MEYLSEGTFRTFKPGQYGRAFLKEALSFYPYEFVIGISILFSTERKLNGLLVVYLL